MRCLPGSGSRAEFVGGLPEDLIPLAHAQSCKAEDALAPLPLLSSGSRIEARASEVALAETLERHHGSTVNVRAFPGLLPAGAGLLSTFQSGGMAPGAPISVTALRDPLEELRHAAARAQRMLDDGTVHSAEEIGLLLPDDPAWLVDAEAVFANLGLHLGALPGAPARDRATEALHLILCADSGVCKVRLSPWEHSLRPLLCHVKRGHW